MNHIQVLCNSSFQPNLNLQVSLAIAIVQITYFVSICLRKRRSSPPRYLCHRHHAVGASKTNNSNDFQTPKEDRSNSNSIFQTSSPGSSVLCEEERDNCIKRKIEFLQSFHGCATTGWYGYTNNTRRGYIDTWRGREFPGLIHPISIDCENLLEESSTTEATKDQATLMSQNEDHQKTTSSSSSSLSSSSSSSSSSSYQSTIHKELEVYLDYAGSSIPSNTLLHNIHNLSVKNQILANPHSSGIAASRTLEFIEQTKKKIIDFFDAQPGQLYGFPNQNDGSINDIESKACTSKCSKEENENESDYHPGYDVIFTSGATESLRIIGENFKWSGSFCDEPQQSNNNSGEYDTNHCFPTMKSVLVYPQNAHTSVIGMRECALSKGAMFRCESTSTITNADESTFQDWMQSSNNKDCEIVFNNRDMCTTSKSEIVKDHNNTINNLLVLPLECNFGGSKLSTANDIIKASKRQWTCSTYSTAAYAAASSNPRKYVHKWFTYLDIAKAACTQQISLKEIDPDFACVSFYKMFGCPTGIGALFIKRSSKYVIQSSDQRTTSAIGTRRNLVDIKVNEKRKYFGGGSVDVVLPTTDFSFPRSNFATSLSHGTINFRGILSLGPGLEEIESLGGMSMISNHTKSLTIEAVKRLRNLKHGNGNNVIIIYGQWSEFDVFDVRKQSKSIPGPTIAFNIVRHDGSYVGYNEVSKLASLNKIPIQLRVGCFCNPGACQEALDLGDEDIKENYIQGGHVCGDDIDIINGKPTGAIRISFGKDSIFEDLDCFISFIEKIFVNDTIQLNERHCIITELQKEVILSEMYIYPIKSCAAMKVTQWNVNRNSGSFHYDREFALVDSEGVALRLKTYPKMGLIHPFIDLWSNSLIVKGEGLPDLVVDLKESFCKSALTREIKVCGNTCGGTIWGSNAASKWFSSFLGVQCWLARYKDSNGSRSGFENEAPILLVSNNAVNRLNKVMTIQGSKQVNAMFFRPNIVVQVPNQDDSNPEDSWKKIVFPHYELEFDVIGPCARCAMVDIDPTSGSKGGKTLRALAQYRRDRGRINFGVFLSCGKKGQGDVSMLEGEKLFVKV